MYLIYNLRTHVLSNKINMVIKFRSKVLPIELITSNIPLITNNYSYVICDYIIFLMISILLLKLIKDFYKILTYTHSSSLTNLLFLMQ